MRDDILGEAAEGVPVDTHQRMVKFAKKDGLQSQRRRRGRKIGRAHGYGYAGWFGMPQFFREAAQHGYVHPYIEPPLGLGFREVDDWGSLLLERLGG